MSVHYIDSSTAEKVSELVEQGFWVCTIANKRGVLAYITTSPDNSGMQVELGKHQATNADAAVRGAIKEMEARSAGEAIQKNKGKRK